MGYWCTARDKLLPLDNEIVSFLTGKIVKSHTKLIFILTPRGWKSFTLLLEERNIIFTEPSKKGPFLRKYNTLRFFPSKKRRGSESGATTEKQRSSRTKDRGFVAGRILFLNGLKSGSFQKRFRYAQRRLVTEACTLSSYKITAYIFSFLLLLSPPFFLLLRLVFWGQKRKYRFFSPSSGKR